MRKIAAALSILGLAGFGGLAPNTAQASPVEPAAATCADNYDIALMGYMYAYSGYYREGYIGKSESWDSDWGNSSGPFQGGDTNVASSVLNKGYDGVDAFQLFNGTGTDWAGGYSCLKRGELYADNLSDNYFSSGYSADNAISSHRWVYASTCNGWFLT